MAREKGLDIFLVQPDANPPVAKIMDYGRYKFEQDKKARDAKKKQHQADEKQIKMRYKIEEHDYQVKLRKAQEAADAARPYAEKMDEVLANLNARVVNKEAASPLLVGTGKDDVHLIVVATADRGLCGAFNANIAKKARAIARPRRVRMNARISLRSSASNSSRGCWPRTDSSRRTGSASCAWATVVVRRRNTARRMGNRMSG